MMRKLILDTDWWTDCDDCVALRLLLNTAADHGVELLGINLDACMEYSLSSMNAFLDCHGFVCPLGLDETGLGYPGRPPYQKPLTDIPSPRKMTRPATDPVTFYRTLLARHREVEILSIGFLNSLARLLASEGDAISPLSGKDLFRQSVKKVWIMGGKFDAQGEAEHNLSVTPLAADSANAVLAFLREAKPPADFLGYEVGVGVLSGAGLPETDALGVALRAHGCHDSGRDSWDPMTALAVLDNGVDLYLREPSEITLDPSGRNFFAPNPASPFAILRKNHPDQTYISLINSSLLPPKQY